MAKINARRLLKLADYLETVPRKRFNMTLWNASLGGPKECGFAGCAIGWATHGKVFRGLKFANDGETPVYENGTGFEAVGLLFSISKDEAESLFGSPCVTGRGKETPHQVSKIIRKFVRDNEKASAE